MTDTLLRALRLAPASAVVIILSMIIGGFVTHLFFYHLYIIVWKGMSTYESKKSHFVSYLFGNPYQIKK